MLHSLVVVAGLPTLVAAAGEVASVVLLRHGAHWGDVLQEADGVVAEHEMEVLRCAKEGATQDTVLHRDIPEGVRGRLRLFCMER